MVETEPLQQYLIGVRNTRNFFVCSSGVAYILQYVKEHTPVNDVFVNKLDTKFNGYGHMTITKIEHFPPKNGHVEVCRQSNVTEACVKVHIKGH